jgi:hypothetical protein
MSCVASVTALRLTMRTGGEPPGARWEANGMAELIVRTFFSALRGVAQPQLAAKAGHRWGLADRKSTLGNIPEHCRARRQAAPCLIATDDEAFTYNNRVNRLSTVQEHLMLRRAVERGVSPERLGRALGVNAHAIAKKATLLDGVCQEAVALLQDRRFSADLTRVLRKMKPSRQVECVELMISANNFSVAYAKGLLIGTPLDGLVDGAKSKTPSTVSPAQMARMEREMEGLRNQYRLAEQSYGQDILELTVALGYLGKLLKNDRITRYLQRAQPDVYEQMAALGGATSLER